MTRELFWWKSPKCGKHIELSSGISSPGWGFICFNIQLRFLRCHKCYGSVSIKLNGKNQLLMDTWEKLSAKPHRGQSWRAGSWCPPPPPPPPLPPSPPPLFPSSPRCVLVVSSKQTGGRCQRRGGGGVGLCVRQRRHRYSNIATDPTASNIPSHGKNECLDPEQDPCALCIVHCVMF